MKQTIRILCLVTIIFAFLTSVVAAYPDPKDDDDQDGVLNFADACPQVPGPAENGGCPLEDGEQQGGSGHSSNSDDLDGDGTVNGLDQCPEVSGPAWNNGCPPPVDADGDGTPDESDQCIDQGGPDWNNGCPASESATDEGGSSEPVPQPINLP